MSPFRCVVNVSLAAVFSVLSPVAGIGDELISLSRSVRWQHLAVESTAPADLEIELAEETMSLQFAELIYGAPGSRCIAIVVAASIDGRSALYVDADRDRVVTDRDCVDGTGMLWLTSMVAEQIIDDVIREFPRQMLVRWQPDHSRLSVATVTTMAHAVTVSSIGESRTFPTQQVDGNANGLFADGRDLLQVDVNEDGRFDPFLETFPFRPLISIRGERWFIKADSFGKRLAFEPASDSGVVKLVVSGQSKQDRVSDAVLTLAGEDGSVYSVSGHNAEIEVPAGRYAASVLYVTVTPDGTDQPWEFTFSRDGRIRKQDWLVVDKDQVLEIDPVGELTMDVVVKRLRQGGGSKLNVQPRLFTSSGLLINLCRVKGRPAYAGPKCTVALVHSDGRPFSQVNSGFS